MPLRSLTHTIALQGWNSHLSISWKAITDLHKHTHTSRGVGDFWLTSSSSHQAKPPYGDGAQNRGGLDCVCACVCITGSPPPPQMRHQHKGSMHHQISFVLHALWRYCCPIKRTPPNTHTHTPWRCVGLKGAEAKQLKRTRHCDYSLPPSYPHNSPDSPSLCLYSCLSNFQLRLPPLSLSLSLSPSQLASRRGTLKNLENAHSQRARLTKASLLT